MATIYIDPSASTDGDGSLASPRNVWPTTGSNNIYLQKAGTTANANVTAFGRSNISFGRYDNGPNPLLNGGSGVALNCSNSINVAIDGLDFLSTGSYGFVWNGGAGISIKNNSVIGARVGISISSTTSNVSNVIIENVTTKNTAFVNENSGLFISAAASHSITGIRISKVISSNNAGFGLYIKAADDDTASPIYNVLIEDSLFNYNGRAGGQITTGMTALDEGKVCVGVKLLRNSFIKNMEPGLSFCARGGNNVIAYNIVSENNYKGTTGSGGLSLSGAKNVYCYGNICNYNHTPYEFDGVGLYLDVALSSLPDAGTEDCFIFGNECRGNRDFAPSVLGSANLSSGIATYHSWNNRIYNNLLVDNGCGVCIGAWSYGNKVYNNTIIGGNQGIVMIWVAASHDNEAKNNIIVGTKIAALSTTSAGSRTTTGNLSLSDTTGIITVTSSQNDFTTTNVGYAIISGSAFAWIISKTNNTTVVAKVGGTAFGSTSINNGSWQLSFGEDQGTWSNYNCIYNNASQIVNGSGQSLVVGANSLTKDPKLNYDFSLLADSPCIGTGGFYRGMRNHSGQRNRTSLPDMGSFQKRHARVQR